jgi:hypothetical protein
VRFGQLMSRRCVIAISQHRTPSHLPGPHPSTPWKLEFRYTKSLVVTMRWRPGAKSLAVTMRMVLACLVACGARAALKMTASWPHQGALFEMSVSGGAEFMIKVYASLKLSFDRIVIENKSSRQ